MTLLWKAFPITTLSVRQFMGGRTARLALLLSCIPALFALIYMARPWGGDAEEFLADIFGELIVPTLLPIVVLLPATAAFGNELEDKTLPYLVMKPVSRLRLVAGKYAAVLLVTIPALLVGIGLTAILASRNDGSGDIASIVAAMAGAVAAAAMLLGAVFLLVSLVIPRALLAGIVYIFAWESLLGRFLPGVEAVSSRAYTMLVFDNLMAGDTTAAGRAALTMAAVAAISLALAVWRLRMIQID